MASLIWMRKEIKFQTYPKVGGVETGDRIKSSLFSCESPLSESPTQSVVYSKLGSGPRHTILESGWIGTDPERGFSRVSTETDRRTVTPQDLSSPGRVGRPRRVPDHVVVRASPTVTYNLVGTYVLRYGRHYRR